MEDEDLIKNAVIQFYEQAGDYSKYHMETQEQNGSIQSYLNDKDTKEISHVYVLKKTDLVHKLKQQKDGADKISYQYEQEPREDFNQYKLLQITTMTLTKYLMDTIIKHAYIQNVSDKNSFYPLKLGNEITNKIEQVLAGQKNYRSNIIGDSGVSLNLLYNEQFTVVLDAMLGKYDIFLQSLEFLKSENTTLKKVIDDPGDMSTPIYYTNILFPKYQFYKQTFFPEESASTYYSIQRYYQDYQVFVSESHTDNRQLHFNSCKLYTSKTTKFALDKKQQYAIGYLWDQEDIYNTEFLNVQKPTQQDLFNVQPATEEEKQNGQSDSSKTFFQQKFSKSPFAFRQKSVLNINEQCVCDKQTQNLQKCSSCKQIEEFISQLGVIKYGKKDKRSHYFLELVNGQQYTIMNNRVMNPLAFDQQLVNNKLPKVQFSQTDMITSDDFYSWNEKNFLGQDGDSDGLSRGQQQGLLKIASNYLKNVENEILRPNLNSLPQLVLQIDKLLKDEDFFEYQIQDKKVNNKHILLNKLLQYVDTQCQNQSVESENIKKQEIDYQLFLNIDEQQYNKKRQQWYTLDNQGKLKIKDYKLSINKYELQLYYNIYQQNFQQYTDKKTLSNAFVCYLIKYIIQCKYGFLLGADQQFNHDYIVFNMSTYGDQQDQQQLQNFFQNFYRLSQVTNQIDENQWTWKYVAIIKKTTGLGSYLNLQQEYQMQLNDCKNKINQMLSFKFEAISVNITGINDGTFYLDNTNKLQINQQQLAINIEKEISSENLFTLYYNGDIQQDAETYKNTTGNVYLIKDSRQQLSHDIDKTINDFSVILNNSNLYKGYDSNGTKNIVYYEGQENKQKIPPQGAKIATFGLDQTTMTQKVFQFEKQQYFYNYYFSLLEKFVFKKFQTGFDKDQTFQQNNGKSILSTQFSKKFDPVPVINTHKELVQKFLFSYRLYQDIVQLDSKQGFLSKYFLLSQMEYIHYQQINKLFEYLKIQEKMVYSLPDQIYTSFLKLDDTYETYEKYRQTNLKFAFRGLQLVDQYSEYNEFTNYLTIPVWPREARFNKNDPANKNYSNFRRCYDEFMYDFQSKQNLQYNPKAQISMDQKSVMQSIYVQGEEKNKLIFLDTGAGKSSSIIPLLFFENINSNANKLQTYVLVTLPNLKLKQQMQICKQFAVMGLPFLVLTFDDIKNQYLNGEKRMNKYGFYPDRKYVPMYNTITVIDQIELYQLYFLNYIQQIDDAYMIFDEIQVSQENNTFSLQINSGNNAPDDNNIDNMIKQQLNIGNFLLKAKKNNNQQFQNFSELDNPNDFTWDELKRNWKQKDEKTMDDLKVYDCLSQIMQILENFEYNMQYGPKQYEDFKKKCTNLDKNKIEYYLPYPYEGPYSVVCLQKYTQPFVQLCMLYKMYKIDFTDEMAKIIITNLQEVEKINNEKLNGNEIEKKWKVLMYCYQQLYQYLLDNYNANDMKKFNHDDVKKTEAYKVLLDSIQVPNNTKVITFYDVYFYLLMNGTWKIDCFTATPQLYNLDWVKSPLAYLNAFKQQSIKKQLSQFTTNANIAIIKPMQEIIQVQNIQVVNYSQQNPILKLDDEKFDGLKFTEKYNEVASKKLTEIFLKKYGGEQILSDQQNTRIQYIKISDPSQVGLVFRNQKIREWLQKYIQFNTDLELQTDKNPLRAVICDLSQKYKNTTEKNIEYFKEEFFKSLDMDIQGQININKNTFQYYYYDQFDNGQRCKDFNGVENPGVKSNNQSDSDPIQNKLTKLFWYSNQQSTGTDLGVTQHINLVIQIINSRTIQPMNDIVLLYQGDGRGRCGFSRKLDKQYRVTWEKLNPILLIIDIQDFDQQVVDQQGIPIVQDAQETKAMLQRLQSNSVQYKQNVRNISQQIYSIYKLGQYLEKEKEKDSQIDERQICIQQSGWQQDFSDGKIKFIDLLKKGFYYIAQQNKDHKTLDNLKDIYKVKQYDPFMNEFLSKIFLGLENSRTKENLKQLYAKYIKNDQYNYLQFYYDKHFTIVDESVGTTQLQLEFTQERETITLKKVKYFEKKENIQSSISKIIKEYKIDKIFDFIYQIQQKNGALFKKIYEYCNYRRMNQISNISPEIFDQLGEDVIKQIQMTDKDRIFEDLKDGVSIFQSRKRQICILKEAEKNGALLLDQNSVPVSINILKQDQQNQNDNYQQGGMFEQIIRSCYYKEPYEKNIGIEYLAVGGKISFNTIIEWLLFDAGAKKNPAYDQIYNVAVNGNREDTYKYLDDTYESLKIGYQQEMNKQWKVPQILQNLSVLMLLCSYQQQRWEVLQKFFDKKNQCVEKFVQGDISFLKQLTYVSEFEGQQTQPFYFSKYRISLFRLQNWINSQKEQLTLILKNSKTYLYDLYIADEKQHVDIGSVVRFKEDEIPLLKLLGVLIQGDLDLKYHEHFLNIFFGKEKFRNTNPYIEQQILVSHISTFQELCASLPEILLLLQKGKFFLLNFLNIKMDLNMMTSIISNLQQGQTSRNKQLMEIYNLCMQLEKEKEDTQKKTFAFDKLNNEWIWVYIVLIQTMTCIDEWQWEDEDLNYQNNKKYSLFGFDEYTGDLKPKTQNEHANEQIEELWVKLFHSQDKQLILDMDEVDNNNSKYNFSINIMYKAFINGMNGDKLNNKKPMMASQIQQQQQQQQQIQQSQVMEDIPVQQEVIEQIIQDEPIIIMEIPVNYFDQNRQLIKSVLISRTPSVSTSSSQSTPVMSPIKVQKYERNPDYHEDYSQDLIGKPNQGNNINVTNTVLDSISRVFLL